jgi:hypothetical protein
MEKLEATVQDARALLKAAKKYEARPDCDGIDCELAALLSGAIERAVASETAQQNAIRDVSRYTDAQNKAMEKAKVLIGKARNAARGRYTTKNEQMMREFHVGAKPTKTVKGMLIEIDYMKTTAEKWVGELTKHGFKAGDLAALGQTGVDLGQIDASQEMAKKTQVNSTESRNNAVKSLLEAIQQVRDTAKSVYAGKKDVLREFSTIKRAKSSKPKKPSAGAGS